jgi:hypothetical protein
MRHSITQCFFEIALEWLTEREIMEDLIGLLALAIECAISILVAHVVGVELPIVIVAVVFVVLAFIGLGVWDKKALEGWRKLAVASVILGIGFFGSDVLLAHLHGQTTLQFRGGLLGLPLTLATWGTAMVSVAGLARALYLKRG